jgi:hypothetical protein
MASGAALNQSAAIAASLGLAATSGAFAQEGLLALDLFFIHEDQVGLIGAAPRSLADFASAGGGRGVLSFGGYWTLATRRIEFQIAKLTVIPEPATTGLSVVGALALATLRRTRSTLWKGIFPNAAPVVQNAPIRREYYIEFVIASSLSDPAVYYWSDVTSLCRRR